MSFGVSDPRFDPPAPATAPEQPAFDGQEPPRQGRGCFFWGCLTLVILFLVMLIGVPLAAYFTLKHYVNKFTADAPLNIVAVELPEVEMQALEARFEAFDASIEKGEPQDLEVTAKEINAMLAQDDQLKGHVLVRIADGKVGGDVSFPANNLPGGEGRHFNAAVDFEVSMVGGVLVVTLADAKVNGLSLPQTFIDNFAGQNFAEGFYKDPESAEVLRKFESLEIVGDKIILKARKQADPLPAAPENEAAEIETFEEAAIPAEN